MADKGPWDDFTTSAPSAEAGPWTEFGGAGPEQQPKSDFSWSQAVTDIPKEIGNEASAGASDVTALANRGEMGPIEGLMATPKAILGAARTVMSPVTGAARSLLGHGMANAEHAVGTVINPEVAAKDNPEQMYETAKGDVDTAMSAARPAGAPVKVPGTSVTTPHPTVPGAQVTTTPRPTYEWQAPPSPTKPVGVVKQPDTEDFFDAAENHYSNMRGFGVEIDPAAMNGVADNILTELHAEGYRPRNAPKVFDAVDELRNPAGQNHEISDIDSVRKVLGKARLDPSERDAARRAIGHIDDYLSNLGNNPQDVVVNSHYAGRVAEEAQAARGNYAVAKRAEDIDEAMDKAQRQAGRAGAGGNINNAIRQQLSSLRNNRKKMTGWTDDEKAELDSVINGSRSANAARQAGKFAPHGIVSTVMSAGAGHMVAPGIGEVAVPAAGWIAKKIGDRLTRIGAERLKNVVKARSPLGKQTSINAAAQAALGPSSSNPRLLSAGVAAALPKHAGPLPAINIRPLTAEGQDQNPQAGFARGGHVNHATGSGGKVRSSDGRAKKAVMRAIKGYAEGGAPEDDYDPFAAEKFINPVVDTSLRKTGRDISNLAATGFDRPEPNPDDPVLYHTASPLANITQGDIDTGLNVGMSAGVGSMKGIKAYHGSPHDFDAFSMDKIGTGEGAQAYGHGLYFAENEGVAGAYKKNLAPASADIAPSWKGDGWQVTTRDGGNFDRQFFSTKEEAEAHAAKFNKGHMYEVNINADPEHFLDWDKPLSEQHPKVQEALKNSVAGTKSMQWGELKRNYLDPMDALTKDTSFGRFVKPEDMYNGNVNMSAVRETLENDPERLQKIEALLDQHQKATALKGSDAYHIMARSFDTDIGGLTGAPRTLDAAEQLHQAGIPGIKYLDQGSRSAGEGSRNFVVFNEKLIDILKKYGIAAAAAPSVAQEIMSQGQQKAKGGSIALQTAYAVKRASQ